MKRTKRTALSFLRALLDLVTLLFLSTLLTFFLLPKLGFPFETVRSGSMEPAIGLSDLLLVDSRDRDLAVGDIAVFRQGGIRIVHRVIAREAKGYRTKGDANSEPDAFLVQRNMVEGRVAVIFQDAAPLTEIVHSKPLFVFGILLCLLQGVFDGGGRFFGGNRRA